MTQESDSKDDMSTTSDLVLAALSASNSAIQFCNSMLHEPLRVLAEELWDKECRKPMAGADIMLISKDDIRRGTNGMLYYIPEDVRAKIRWTPEDDTGQVDMDTNADLIPEFCELRRVIAQSIRLDLHILQIANDKHLNLELQAFLEDGMRSLVQEARSAGPGRVSAVTMPQMSVTHGATPIEVMVHMYGLMGVMPVREVNSGA